MEDGLIGDHAAEPPQANAQAVLARLARSESRLAEAQRVAHIGSFEWDVGSDIVTWSDELARIFGMEPGETAGSYAGFLARVHPDDLPSTRATLALAYRHPGPFAYDHRIVREDGAVRVLHTRAEVVTDAVGRPMRLVGSCWDITEMQQAGRRIEHTRSLLEATIQATADGLLVVDLTGHITIRNQRFLSLWRFPQDLARATNDNQLLAFAQEQLIDPNTFLSGVRTLYGHPERESFDVLRFKDGRVYERYSAPQRLGDSIVGRVWSFRDVTDRDRLLRRAQFLGDATRLLVSLDVEPALDGVARMALPVLGVACAVDLLEHDAVRRIVSVSLGSAPTPPELKEPAHLPGQMRVVAQGNRWLMTVPFVVKEQIIGVLSFLSAEERPYVPIELDLAENLGRRCALSVENARLYQHARESLQARDEMLAIAAHEIRGPITAIHLAVQGMIQGKVPADSLPKVLGILQREDRRLARFVDELINVGRIRSGSLQFVFERVDLEKVVRDVSEQMRSELERVGSELVLTTEGKPVGEWDRFRLEQVVTNLVGNAAKFGRGKPIEVNLREAEGLVTLSVRDHGIGVAPEMRERIFQPFERAVSGRHYGGLGLGLHIVRTIVHGLGGGVVCTSELNQGSTFTVTLPQARVTS